MRDRHELNLSIIKMQPSPNKPAGVKSIWLLKNMQEWKSFEQKYSLQEIAALVPMEGILRSTV
jgi:hypothetical protein